MMAEETKPEQEWGRVLICGGTDWATNGNKNRPKAASNDLLQPHIVRSLSNLKIVKIITGCVSNFSVVIDVFGTAYLFGKFGGNKEGISHTDPRRITPSSVGLKRGRKFIGGATGRSHVLLVDDEGGVWGCGGNAYGQLGMTPCMDVPGFRRVTGPWMKDPEAKVVQVTAGVSFSLFLTNKGQVYASGSSEKGQLGNGKTGEHLIKGGKIGFDVEVTPRLLTAGIGEIEIVKIASGNAHSLAMSKDGQLFSWGYNGYCRLGLGDQKDRVVPTLVAQFSGGKANSRVKDITCGPANSVVLDGVGTYLMTGRWKVTGDGSGGSPYTTFKAIQELMGQRIDSISSGGSCHFLTVDMRRGSGVYPRAVGFGQGAIYGELGLGQDLKSSTKPVELAPLNNIHIMSIAAGTFHTLFLARAEDVADLPRFPEEIESESLCLVCGEERGSNDPCLECEKCDAPYHPSCLTPPLSAWPEDQWFCPDCTREGETDPDADPAVAGDTPHAGKGSSVKLGVSGDDAGSRKRRGDSGTPSRPMKKSKA